MSITNTDKDFTLSSTFPLVSRQTIRSYTVIHIGYSWMWKDLVKQYKWNHKLVWFIALSSFIFLNFSFNSWALSSSKHNLVTYAVIRHECWDTDECIIICWFALIGIVLTYCHLDWFELDGLIISIILHKYSLTQTGLHMIYDNSMIFTIIHFSNIIFLAFNNGTGFRSDELLKKYDNIHSWYIFTTFITWSLFGS